MNFIAIIPAAGSGSRFGGETPKQYLPLAGKPVIAHSIERFLTEPDVERVIVAVAVDYLQTMRDMIAARGWGRITLVEGGRTRQESVTRAMESVREEDRVLIAVHDAVRPLFRRETFRRTLDAAELHGASVPVVPVTDTLHRVESEMVVETADRSVWFAAQTPQCFRASVLRRALEQARKDSIDVTDDAAAVRRVGAPVCAVAGDATNIKITREDDLRIAAASLEQGGAQ